MNKEEYLLEKIWFLLPGRVKATLIAGMPYRFNKKSSPSIPQTTWN
jgi:hypothetical protein